MKKHLIATLFSLVLILSCSKDNNSDSNTLVGTWVFTDQVTNSYAYPSVLAGNSSAIGHSAWSVSLDSINVTFDNNGNYSFRNFRLPVDVGKYTIAQDSFLIIAPDTAGFVKFNYTTPSFSAGTGVPSNPAYTPYANFKFTSDTIRFKRTTSGNIVFSGAWLSKANNPIVPGNDTLLLVESLNRFKRQ